MQNLFGDEVKDEKTTGKKRVVKVSKEEDKMAKGYKEPDSFEKAIADLEEAIQKLENGQTPLEETLEIYRRAKFLAGWCYKKLAGIQGELKKLGLDENGNFKLEDFPTLD